MNDPVAPNESTSPRVLDLSMRLADSGKSSRLWVMAQCQAPYVRQHPGWP